MWNVVDDFVPDLFPIRHCCFYTTWSANKAPEIKELSARGFNLLKRDRWGTQARHSTYFLSLPVVWRRDGSDSIYARLRRWGQMKDDAFCLLTKDSHWTCFHIGCLRDRRSLHVTPSGIWSIQSLLGSSGRSLCKHSRPTGVNSAM